MSLKPLPLNTSRFEGCTLTGALSVTTSVRNSISVVHGPRGCAHHNFSLLHATSLEHDGIGAPAIQSSGLLEKEIIFGGEAALEQALSHAVSLSPSCIFVLSTCIAETIGDDAGAVCRKDWGVPVIPVPTGGFLGGVFEKGVNNALCTLSDMAEPRSSEGTVNIIGEKNLEFEVEENFKEVSRLLSVLGLFVNTRFVHNISDKDIAQIGRASFNVLRDPGACPVGDHLKVRFGTAYIPSFPAGLAGTIQFLEMAAAAGRVPFRSAVADEIALQEEVLNGFSDLAGSSISPNGLKMTSPVYSIVREVTSALDMGFSDTGCHVPVPLDPPVGTAGIQRMLHRWRRAIHA
ncbi:MAG: oxidoreductase [Methanoregula sp.]|nr:MAG: oxidoreductase [Methanoregula sp.]